MELKPKTLSQFLAEKPTHPTEIISGGLVYERNITLVIGPAKLGKSFFVSNMAMAMASGMNFMDHYRIRTPQNVLMVQQEVEPASVQDRLKRIGTRYGVPDKLLLINQRGVKIDNIQHFNILKQVIKQYQIQVLIMDPLKRFHNVDENDSRDMGIIMDKVEEFCEMCAVVLVHHSGKPRADEQTGLYFGRGSSVIADYVSASIALKPTESKTKHMAEIDLRYREAPAPFMVMRDGNFIYREIG